MSFQKMVNAMKRRSGSWKILLVGLDNAGKTTILNALLGTECMVPPTFGYRIHALELGSRVLTIVDIGGQTSFKRYWPSHFESIDGVLFVFDCSDNRDFSEYLQSVLELSVPVCIMANKIDLNPLFAGDSPVPEGSVPDIKLFRTSALDKQSVMCGFQWLLEQIASPHTGAKI